MNLFFEASGFFAGIHFFYVSYAFIFLRLRFFLLLFIFFAFASSPFFFAFLRLFMLFCISYAFSQVLLRLFIILLKRLTVGFFHAYLHTSPKKAHRWLFNSYKACR